MKHPRPTPSLKRGNRGTNDLFFSEALAVVGIPPLHGFLSAQDEAALEERVKLACKSSPLEIDSHVPLAWKLDRACEGLNGSS